ncbi:MAG: phytoene desaturase family protein [Sandaracinaceae bacterium]
MERRSAIVIGSGFGGLAVALRLQSMGFDTTVLEKLDGPGGRAYTRKVDGFTFDMGPTVLTVPHFIEELFALEPGKAGLSAPDFPPHTLTGERVKTGISGGPATSRYVDIVPILPFYRIYFDDGTYFDYDGDPEHTREQIRAISPRDLEGYERFHAKAKAIFDRGFLELGYTHFTSVGSMLGVLPDLVRLDAVRPLFTLAAECFESDKLRAVFSFEPLLVGGNPLSVPGIYAMIHFVEKTWGIHFAKGGTGALVAALVKKLEELGGRIRYGAEVRTIEVVDERGRPATKRTGRRIARGVTLMDGERLEADVVVSNADYVHTYGKLIDPRVRLVHHDVRMKLARQSMSVVVIYFGFRDDGSKLDLQHHNIILGPRYEGLLEDIFDRKILAKDFSQYLHVPTLTDPSLAPPGHHTAYTLIPVPHNGSGLDWTVEGPRLVDEVLRFLEVRGYIPNLAKRLVHKSFITPDYFEQQLNSHLGNAFGLEPVLWQSAFFRPHNRSEDIEGLYLVGAGYQPGGGTPSVMMSAKITARAIAEDYKVSRRVLDAVGTGGARRSSEDVVSAE